LEFRFDRSAIGNWQETPEGFLRIRATFARTGCQTYRNFDGSQRVEYRPESEVAREDSFLSLGGLPVTLEHPPQLLTPDTARQYQRGASGTHVTYDNGFVHGTVVLTDREAIEAVKRGDATELSVGYRCEYDATPGVAPDGTRFDGTQRSISGNHHAITSKARAGSEVRLHFDSADQPSWVGISTESFQTPTEEPDMAARTARTDMKPEAPKGGMPKDEDEEKPMASDEDMEDMEEDDDDEEGMSFPPVKPKAKAKTDSADNRTVPWAVYKASLDDLAAAEQRFDALEEQITEIEKQLDARTDSSIDQQRLDALVAERVEVLDKAAAITGARSRHDGLTNRQVQELALKSGGVKVDQIETRSDDYVAARFDAAHEAAAPLVSGTAEALALQLQGLTTPRSDAARDNIAAAEQEMADTTSNAWKNS